MPGSVRRQWRAAPVCALLLGTGGALACAPAPPAPPAPQPDPVFRTVLRQEGDDGVHTYRIPALATTRTGTLLAAFDVRHQDAGDLPGDIDVGLMRSTDNGTTWGPMRVILDFDKDAPGAEGNGVGDPAILADHRTGRVMVVALWSHGNRAWSGSEPGLSPEETGQLVMTRSDDDGLSWSAPINLTGRITGRDSTWRLLFNGPGNGIQLHDGTLVFPAQFRDSGGTPHSTLIYSTDGGDSWALTPPALPFQPPTSEAQVAQLADGTLLLTMRDESRSGTRAWARYTWREDLSKGEWSAPWFTVADPTVMASLVQYPDGPLLLSNPNSATERINLTIRTSTDGGRTWSGGRLLDPRPCAYSSLTVLADGDIAALYECGDANAYQALTFARFSLRWVEGAAGTN